MRYKIQCRVICYLDSLPSLLQEQAFWICNCNDKIINKTVSEFKNVLSDLNSIEQWTVWLESIVNYVLKPYRESMNFPIIAREFLTKWSFYRSVGTNFNDAILSSYCRMIGWPNYIILFIKYLRAIFHSDPHYKTSIYLVVRWWSGTWQWWMPFLLVPFNWSVCYTTSTCTIWWNTKWRPQRERLRLPYWENWTKTPLYEITPTLL